ncbi:Methyl-CpG-binding domain protein 4, partial [Colletotrichum chlorophyti]
LAIYDLGLLSGYEDWNLMLESAASMKQRTQLSSQLDAQDLLAFVPRVEEATLARQKLHQGWAATDQSIRNLSALLRFHGPAITVAAAPQPVVRRERTFKRARARVEDEDEDGDDADEAQLKQRVKRQKTVPKASTSHYFAPAENEQSSNDDSQEHSESPNPPAIVHSGSSALIHNGIATPSTTPRKQSHEDEAPNELNARRDIVQSVKVQQADSQGSSGRGAILANPQQQSVSDELVRVIVPRMFEPSQVRELAPPASSPKRTSAVKSPFFNQSPVKLSPKSKRVGGLVSTIPFPPLSAPRFGLIQEEFAHHPFWLLVVVTFLVKTAGTLAIPTFYKVKEHFPSPAALADPDSAPAITEMIHHLGLSMVRTATIQRYARVWLEKPPTAGVTYRVKNYDVRDIEPCVLRSGDLDLSLAEAGPSEADDSWEMGHLTQGKYALDSWRIFCRDELLGRAQDWNGKGAAPNFQPEWMRVRPDDKELRACLRWMWMREGWEWDPATGEKAVLRDEMRKAVNEGRVEYDETGGLKMLDEPRAGSA